MYPLPPPPSLLRLLKLYGPGLSGHNSLYGLQVVGLTNHLAQQNSQKFYRQENNTHSRARRTHLRNTLRSGARASLLAERIVLPQPCIKCVWLLLPHFILLTANERGGLKLSFVFQRIPICHRCQTFVNNRQYMAITSFYFKQVHT